MRSLTLLACVAVAAALEAGDKVEPSVKVSRTTKNPLDEDVYWTLSTHPELLSLNHTAWLWDPTRNVTAEVEEPASQRFGVLQSMLGVLAAGGFADGPRPANASTVRGLVVRTRVRPVLLGVNVSFVGLHYKTMFGVERRARMVLDGEDTYVGVIPTGDVRFGDMLRYYVSASGTDGSLVRKPRTRSYGTVVRPEWARDGASSLPVMHWYVAEPEAARTDEGTTCSLAFDAGGGLRFYDGVKVRRRGSGRHDAESMFEDALKTKDWEKRKFKLDFDGAKFVYDPRKPPVEEFNLHSIWREPAANSYVREVLANAFFDEVGVPAATAFFVRLELNNEFYGLYAFVEQVDETWLERSQLPSNSSLYKAVHWKYSNLRPPNSTTQPLCPFAQPDWPTPQAWGKGWYCPSIWRPAGGADESQADLMTFATRLADVRSGRDRLFLFEAVDVFAVINEHAAQTLVLNADRCTKNYYMLRHAGTQRWSRVAWDLEDSFATDDRAGRGVDRCQGCRMDGTYCLLTCEWWASPLFCDSSHPQDTFAGASSTFNHLSDAVFRDATTRTMYFGRLRSLMEDYLASGWMEAMAKSLSERVRHDAWLDDAKWATGDPVRGLEQLLEQISVRRAQLFDEYGRWFRRSDGSGVTVGAVTRSGVDGPQMIESVLVLNGASESTDLSGWRIDFQAAGGVQELWHVFPGGTVLPSGASLTVHADLRKAWEAIRQSLDTTRPPLVQQRVTPIGLEPVGWGAPGTIHVVARDGSTAHSYPILSTMQRAEPEPSA